MSLLREVNEDAAAFMLRPEDERAKMAAEAFSGGGVGSVAVPRSLARAGAPTLDLPVSGAKLGLLKSSNESLTPLAAEGLQSSRQRVADVSLSEVYNHPELYSALPELKDIRVLLRPNRAHGGSYSPNDNMIVADYNDMLGLRELLRHETTHAVAHKTGAFPQGTNPEAMKEILTLALDAARMNQKAGIASPLDKKVADRLIEGRAIARGYGKSEGFFPYLAQEGEVAANWAGGGGNPSPFLPPVGLMHNIQGTGDVYKQIDRLPMAEQLILWREAQLAGRPQP